MDLLSPSVYRLYYAYLHRYWPSIPEDDPGHDIPHAIGNSGDKISDLEKYCMALQEREARAKQLSDFNNRIGEDIHLLKAIIESMRTRTSEMRKEAYEFQVCYSTLPHIYTLTLFL